jgi:hypothetical protein
VFAEANSGAVLVGRVFLSRAFAGESPAELLRAVRLASMARRDARQPIICFIVVDRDAELPSEEARAALRRAAQSLLGYCEFLAFIVEGAEVRQTLLRSMLRSMTTGVGSQPSRVRVVDSLEAAARTTGGAELLSEELLREGRRAGVLSFPEALPRSGNP